MSFWSGRDVTLRLTASGKAALAGLFEGDVVGVSVQWADELGIWVLLRSTDEVAVQVALIRWNYFETAIMDVILTEPQKPKVIGFDVWQSGKRV